MSTPKTPQQGRERPVACQVCRAMTWRHDALCNAHKPDEAS